MRIRFSDAAYIASNITFNEREPCDHYIEMLDDLGLDYSRFDHAKYRSVEQRLKQAWIVSRVCTDTLVGVCAVYLYGEFAAIVYRKSRKDDVYVCYASVKMRDALRDFFLSCMEDEIFDMSHLDEGFEFKLYSDGACINSLIFEMPRFVSRDDGTPISESELLLELFDVVGHVGERTRL